MSELFAVCFIGIGVVTVGFALMYVAHRVLLWWDAI